MSSHPFRLGRLAGATLVVAGAVFIAVQINHPPLTLVLVGTREFVLRESAKIAMAGLALTGITTLTVWHGRRFGLFGRLSAALFGAGYLAMLCVQTIAALVLPAIAATSPDYVRSVLAAAKGGQAATDIGGIQVLLTLSGIGYLLGGLLFGIALFRAGVVARWAGALLAVATTSTVALAVLPEFFARVLAIPTGIAFIGIGWSAWQAATRRPVEVPDGVRVAQGVR